jgi:hypothetical protein
VVAAIIEFNDHELRVAKEGKIVVRSAGCAIVQGAEIQIGQEACQQACIQPRDYHNRFWYQLDQSALRRSSRAARHHADLAFKHLEHVHKAAGAPTLMVLAIPGGFSREQLALLLGIAEACKIKTVAVVDAAVAAAANCVAPGSYKHIEIQRHRAVITDIVIDEHVTRTNIEAIDGAGFDKLMAQFVAFFADQFLAQSRFDPLHQATTEQLLYNQMPKWLELLRSRREIKVHIEYRGSRFEVRIPKDDIVAVARPIYNNILDHRSLKDRCVIGSRLAAMPGFVESRTNQMVLPEAAVFGGCAALAERPADTKGGVRLLTQLPAAASPTIGKFLESAVQSRPDSRSSTIVPTHVLCGANAYEITATPLYLSIDDSVERVCSKQSLASLRRNGIATYLVAENDARLRLNGRPVSDDTALGAGDEITVEGAACVYMPINVVSPDAT